MSLTPSVPERRAAPTVLARRAEALGARLPPLMVAAERVAATVAQGVHGRRRVGEGDSFWQFRPYVQGDALSRVDWRQSARADRAFVRETEWEAAQTVLLWRDGSPSMRWCSRNAGVEKLARADLLLLALASLLLRGGERVRLLAPSSMSPGMSLAGRGGLDRLARELERAGSDESGALPNLAMPRHAQAVLLGDFLAPLAEIEAMVGRLAAMPVRGHLLQILDPAEADLPYQGRVRFRGLEREADTLIPRVEGVRTAYGAALTRQVEGLHAICAAAGFTYGLHRTDHVPESALLGLYTALAPR
jgi:uncharacterized protein (DUF58 family)